MKSIHSAFLFFQKYDLILLSISFFLIWKFFLIALLWQGRFSPPEPDDSYSYISTISSASLCQDSFLCNQYTGAVVSDYSSYIQLSYKIIFGGFAKTFSLSPHATYEISFYIGTILLAGALLIFLRSFTKNTILISLCLFFLALCHGSGEIHGFYWVVPSFFSTLLFFLIAAFIIDDSPHPLQYWTLPILIALFIFMHPLSAYFLLILPLYAFIQSLFERKISTQTIKKIITVSIIGILFIYIQSVLMEKNGQNDPYGIQIVLPQITTTLSKIQHGDKEIDSSYSIITNNENAPEQRNTSYLFHRIQTMKTAYFQWFFPHWIIIFPFLLLLYLLYKNRAYKIISLYLATLIFFVASTLFNQFGFRSAIILWPMTYIIYALGLSRLFFIATEKIPQAKSILRKTSLGILITASLFFVVLNMLYATIINTNLNTRNNYKIDNAFTNYLLKNTNPGDTIYIPRLVRQSIFGSELFLRNKIVPPEQNPKYLALIERNIHESNHLNQQIRNSINAFLLLAKQDPYNEPGLIKTQNPPPHYVFERAFGDILIYHNSTIP